MPGAGPSWLTGWVKLNNKHVVVHAASGGGGKGFAMTGEEEKCQQTATTARSPSTEISSKSTRRNNWSRKHTKEKTITIDESSDDDVLVSHNSNNNNIHHHHHLSHQILSEAAFMTEVADPVTLLIDEVHSKVAPRNRTSPEGLIVTAIVEKPRPPPQHHNSSSNNHHLNHRLAAVFPGDRESCKSCIALEKKLDEVFDDLEYMRSVALQQEQASTHRKVANNECFQCGSNLRSGSFQPCGNTAATNELQELAQRHKQVVEALLSERVSALHHCAKVRCADERDFRVARE